MSKTVEIVLTRTVKVGGVYRAPGEVVEVTKKQALEILTAGAGREQPSLARPSEKGGKKPQGNEAGNAQGGTDEGQGSDDTSGQNAD